MRQLLANTLETYRPDWKLIHEALQNAIDSFIGPVAVENANSPIQCVFIRAPRFTGARKPSVIATFDGEPVGVRESNRIALTFHPELSGTTIFHEMLIEAALSVQRGATA